MKSKQLANVLIKSIGLYICLCAIPGLVSGVLLAFASTLSVKWSESLSNQAFFAIGDVVKAVGGIFIIIKSRKIADIWFKDDNE